MSYCEGYYPLALYVYDTRGQFDYPEGIFYKQEDVQIFVAAKYSTEEMSHIMITPYKMHRIRATGGRSR